MLLFRFIILQSLVPERQLGCNGIDWIILVLILLVIVLNRLLHERELECDGIDCIVTQDLKVRRISSITTIFVY